MSNENSPPPTPSSPTARRASFSPGQFLGRGAHTGNGGTSAYPTPIATAAANAQAQHRRRLSVTSLGLSGSPTQASAFARARQGSLSSGTSNNTWIDENAIEEGDAAPMASSPIAGVARRLSSGARALRDARTGSGNANGRSPTGPKCAPSVKGRGRSSSTPHISLHSTRWRFANARAVYRRRIQLGRADSYSRREVLLHHQPPNICSSRVSP